jgi:predicted extracellular nuclease
MRVLLVAILLLVSASASSLTIMEINTEFLWDYKAPHDGQLIKGSKIPTKTQYQNELQYYKTMIEDENADIVGLIEIEGCHIAKDLSLTLSGDWEVACKKGRDTYTGQDVAIITKYKVLPNTIDNHKNSYAKMQAGSKAGKKIRPSKALSVVIANGRKTFLVTIAHLISKRGDNDAKRLAQASAISITHKALHEKYKTSSQIILGDLNDTPDSPVLGVFYGIGFKVVSQSVCTYTYKGKCDLIDHILVADEYAGGSIYTKKTMKSHTDHSILVYRY